MWWKSLLIVAALAIFLGVKLKTVIEPPPVPKLEENTWWAEGKWREDKSIRSFKINITDEVLEDLKYRLDNARDFTPPLEGIAQEYGMNTNLLKEIVEFWRNKYDWKTREKYLNKYPQFLTNIQGLDIHYIHVKPKVPNNVRVLPLLLLHGWPGSVREFYETIPLLTTPREGVNFVFEVIVPSIPGYGFSSPAVRPGLGATQIAVVFKNFMARLGHTRYYLQGGDFGAIILKALAVLYPQSVLGYHSNFCIVNTPLSRIKSLLGVVYQPWYVKPEHADRVYPLGKHFGEMLLETGYLHLQATKPDTIGVALKDSAVGLAAYILEKFVTGTNFDARYQVDGGLKKVYDYADLLDNVMIYWVTGSMPTAIRLYAETFSSAHYGLGIDRIPLPVPAACARFKHDFYSPDGALTEIYTNMVQLTDYDGGHFAAFQVPAVLANDVFVAVQKFEELNK